MFQKKIKLRNSYIGEGCKPYIIAEIGSNFNQDINIAKELIDVAAYSKVQAVKFQLFNASLLYPDKGKMYQIFKSIELNKLWIGELKKYARKKNLSFLCSPFDNISANYLNKMNIDAFKIASSEANNLKLIKQIAKFNKPMIISTGMCDLSDVLLVIEFLKEVKFKKLILMHCTTQYPVEYKNINLNVLNTFKKLFDFPIGFSDHTDNNFVAPIALGMGATVFEKHITLSKKMKGPDHFFALEPKELNEYVSNINFSYISLGSSNKEIIKFEKLNGRRDSIYAAKNINKGEVLNTKNIKIKRPLKGINIKYLNEVLKFKTNKKIKKNDSINWSDLDY